MPQLFILWLMGAASLAAWMRAFTFDVALGFISVPLILVANIVLLAVLRAGGFLQEYFNDPPPARRRRRK